MTENKILLIATNNKGKLREYVQLLAGVPFKLITLDDAGVKKEVAETGLTMVENAIKKACDYAALTGIITVADDSGLEVDILDGKPGAFSRRFSAENATDKERNEYLLAKLREVSWGKRTARFRCVIAVAFPRENVETFEGICEGIIAFEPKGDHGFGYDPIFYLPELDKHMAELTLAEKNKVSHRARAVQNARPFLEHLK